MKFRKLELASLEDRSVPSASLATYTAPAQPAAVQAVAVVASHETSQPAVSQQEGYFGKLATNHNETLVRDRRARRRQSR